MKLSRRAGVRLTTIVSMAGATGLFCVAAVAASYKNRLIVVNETMMASASEQGSSTASDGNREVTVCKDNQAAFAVGARAENIASGMFARIGVTIHWHSGLRSCPLDIRVTVASYTPADFKPGALAYALPYEGTHIRIFFDRISGGYPERLIAPMLGHVLVHEVTHILQGAVHHSDHGIMKANWESEISNIDRKPLDFAQTDIDLIYRGLAARQARAKAAIQAPAAGITH